MAQHLRVGSEVNIAAIDSNNTVYSGATVTNLTEGYIEFSGGGYGSVALPWTSVIKVSVTTD